MAPCQFDCAKGTGACQRNSNTAMKKSFVFASFRTQKDSAPNDIEKQQICNYWRIANGKKQSENDERAGEQKSRFPITGFESDLFCVFCVLSLMLFSFLLCS